MEAASWPLVGHGVLIFQEVLAELVGDKSLERFRQGLGGLASLYEKLHVRALKKSPSGAATKARE